MNLTLTTFGTTTTAKTTATTNPPRFAATNTPEIVCKYFKLKIKFETVFYVADKQKYIFLTFLGY